MRLAASRGPAIYTPLAPVIVDLTGPQGGGVFTTLVPENATRDHWLTSAEAGTVGVAVTWILYLFDPDTGVRQEVRRVTTASGAVSDWLEIAGSIGARFFVPSGLRLELFRATALGAGNQFFFGSVLVGAPKGEQAF